MKVHYNVKGKFNNMEQLEMEYQEIDIWKVNEFNFLNEKVEEFSSSQNLVNLRSPSCLMKKNLSILFMRYKQIIYSVFLSDMVMCC